MVSDHGRGGSALDRRLRLNDLYRVRLPGDIVVSPDGRSAVVAVSEHHERIDRTTTNLWLVDLDGEAEPHRLTHHDGVESAPRWSPDGHSVAFLADRPEMATAPPKDAASSVHGGAPDSPRRQVWRLDLRRGGEPVMVSRLPEGVEGFDWSPDGTRLVVSARTPTATQARHLQALRDGKRPHVIDRLQHKRDGVGFLDEVPTHLHVVDAGSGASRQITFGEASERLPAWSPDGRWIAFQSNRTGDPDSNNRMDLWLVTPDGAAGARLTQGDLACERPVWSPDGDQVAAIALVVPENRYALRQLVLMNVADAVQVEDLAREIGVGWRDMDSAVPRGATADPVQSARRYPVPLERTRARVFGADLDRPLTGPVVWVDRQHLLTLAGDRGRTRLCLVDLAAPAGAEAELVFPAAGERTVEGFDTAQGRVGLLLASPTLGTEACVIEVSAIAREGAKARPVSAFFEPLRADRDLAPYRPFAVRNSDGMDIEGFVALPPGFDPDHPTPTPLLVSIHGGPMAYDSPNFAFDHQYWAAQGYLVLMVNYRGSTSYGEAFCTVIQGDWGPREHDDVMRAVDRLVREGWAEPDRMYVTGFSYGGIMTNWAIGHTDRFRAAVSEHGVWDNASAFGTDDCQIWWQDDLGLPWQNPDGYRRTSAASAVEQVVTPVMIMAGTADSRCAFDQSEAMYVAVRKHGVEARLVAYPGEHHAISRPSRAMDRLYRIGDWLAGHEGLPVDAGDVPAWESESEG